MLSYQHAYHAGNFADVLKHIVLCSVIDYLKQKEKPFYFHDTHAGRGLYPLSLPEMNKTNEYQQGIVRLWPLLHDDDKCPIELLPYKGVLKKYNAQGVLQKYPGSGIFAHALMRREDRLVLTELHPAEYETLHKNTKSLFNVRTEKIDAWQGLRAAVPPIEKRGVILIDPSYELKNEHRQVVDGLAEALQRFATGVYLIWYPLLDNEDIAKPLIRGIQKLNPPSLLRVELSPCDSAKKGLIGSGMLIINAPWKLENELKNILPLLNKYLADDKKGSFLIQNYQDESNEKNARLKKKNPNHDTRK